jgi:hypothetical protein
MSNNSLIRTWEKAYEITLPTVWQLKQRLKELQTWDKPIGSPTTNKSGKWREWACKKIALEGLISEKS